MNEGKLLSFVLEEREREREASGGGKFEENFKM
jgi:hypothetical protein